MNNTKKKWANNTALYNTTAQTSYSGKRVPYSRLSYSTVQETAEPA